MARFTAREIGRIETTYTSELATLSWTWIMKPNGKVLYRLSHINGRSERGNHPVERRPLRIAYRPLRPKK